jgi:hypothetical protein
MPVPLELPPEPEEAGADEATRVGAASTAEASVAGPGRPPREHTARDVAGAVAKLIGYSIAAAAARAYWGLRFRGR